MTAQALLKELHQRKVILEPRQGRLHFSAPKGALTPSLRQALTQCRDELMDGLSHQVIESLAVQVFPGSVLEDESTWSRLTVLASEHYLDPQERRVACNKALAHAMKHGSPRAQAVARYCLRRFQEEADGWR